MRKIYALIGLAFLSACMELPEMATEDGTPATPQDVYRSVEWGWNGGQQDSQAILKGESVQFVRSAELLGQSPQPFEVQRLDVLTVPTTEDPTYQVASTILDLSNNNQKPNPPRVYRFTPNLDPYTGDSQVKNIFPLHEVGAYSQYLPLSIHHASFYATICMPNENIQWKPFCYNLRSWEAQEPVPPEVAKRKDAENKCEGIVNCIMNVRYVAFDLVTEVFDEEKGAMTRMKQIIQMKFSSDVPLLSRLLSVCYQGIGTYKKQPYVATICTDVMDFERENPPPPTP